MYLLLFLTAELDGGEWSASRPGRFTSGRRLEGLRSGKGVFEKRNTSYPDRDWNPGSSSLWPSHYTAGPVLAPFQN